MTGLKALSAVAVLGLALGGCTSMSVFKDDAAPPPAPKVAEAPPAPEPDVDKMSNAQARKGQSAGGLSAARIRAAVAGKSFKWVGPNNSGTTLFAQDGTSLVEVDGKGQISGKWSVRDGLLCESFDPAPILPKGSDEKCNPFSGTGGRYKVGPATFTPS